MRSVDLRQTARPGLQRVVERLARFNSRHPWSHNDHFHGWILRKLPPGRGSALDVGCGRGELLVLLAGRYAAVTGIDQDPDMVAAAAGRCAPLPQVTVVNAAFPGVAGSYDLITMVAVLHHLPLDETLTHIRRLLRPGGRLLVVGLARPASTPDLAWRIASALLNPAVGMIKHPRAAVPASPPFPVRTPTLSFDELRSAVAVQLPGARIRRRLFFRYTLAWTAPHDSRRPHVGGWSTLAPRPGGR